MPSFSRFSFISLIVLSMCRIALAVPGDVPPAAPNQPAIAAASDEGEQALASFRIPRGLKGQLWAAEPMLANPVAFCIDNRGRIFVCETFRQKRGIEDNRDHAHWLDDDLAAQTVADRLAYIKKHLGDKADDFTQHDDRIRLIEDANGAGRANKSTIFAEHFNGILDGTAAGVLFHRGSLYVTCIPDLWLLKDTDGDGRADVRNSLSHGYGVRFAFRGHDMHGLAIGPDGRLYFSIGDRGLNVGQNGRHLINAESGSVLRCELDGTNLELFATGLRNPQELAFDDFGNLFTGDNNSDSGDQARWVHLVEGGDSGWRMAYQYLSDRGPFNREKLWHPQHDGQPAYIVPPVANIASGPSGLAYYPGTGLPEHFQGRFLLADFRGGPANSGIRSFRVKPKGASFELVDTEQEIWNVLATDIDFGPDGAIYLTDWVNGWNGEGKGRIYKFSAPEVAQSAAALEVKQLLANGFAQRSTAELIKLLSHVDRRVRMEAQFALVDKKATNELAAVTKTDSNQFARIHALWGLSQLHRRGAFETLEALGALILPLLDDSDSEIRAQAAKVLGDCGQIAACEKLILRLTDESSRVQLFAAQSMAKFGRPEAIPALTSLLAANDDRDAVLRHAAVMGLVGSSQGMVEQLLNYAKDPSAAVRMGIVLALRHLCSEEVAVLLDDANPHIVVEAARAIYDVPIPAAMPKLAGLISRGSQDEALMRRVLAANFRLGARANAEAIAVYAGRSDAPTAMRLEALDMLRVWAKPSGRDRVLGMWRPIEERAEEDATNALRKNLASSLNGPESVRSKAGQVAAALGIKEVIPELHRLLADTSQSAEIRANALPALLTLRDPDLDVIARRAVTDNSSAVRAAARTLLAQRGAPDALGLLSDAVRKGDRVERQAALLSFGDTADTSANKVIGECLDALLAGNFPADAHLDLLTAAAQRNDGSLNVKLSLWEARRPADDPLAPYAECLEGGDVARGRQLFFERAQLSCVRCHKIGDTGGDVGPELTKIAMDKQRAYLLEAIVAPNITVAKNFETVVILDTDGQQHTGILRQENDQQVTLITAEAKLITIPKANIEARKAGNSSMPEDLIKHLSKTDLRDLVEFLSSLK